MEIETMPPTKPASLIGAILIVMTIMFARTDAEELPAEQQLLTEVRDFAKKIYETQHAEYATATTTMHELCWWSRRWLDAELALHPEPAEQTKVIDEQIARMTELAESIEGNFHSRQDDAVVARYYIKEAELMLVRLKRR